MYKTSVRTSRRTPVGDLFEQGELLARAFLDGGDQPAGCFELLD
jgi:hypothetical protein